ncbi:MAG: hypothetical protein H0X30_13615 [Anaerolineae bacterium]|nr:hypothetical protein [Anaerolineae bacterium]
MHHRKRFILLITIGLISLFAMKTILAQDNNGHGHGNGNGNGNGNNGQVTQPAPGDNGNHQGGGNNGNGNGNDGSKKDDAATEQPTLTTSVQMQNTSITQQNGGLLGCQKNNPSRLDCSSLDVKGMCDGGTAVFIIHNSGSPGDGDMRAPTQYRLLVDGVVVQTGSVQLTGGASGLVTYNGSGSVTIEVDQQVGHPGNSHPRASLNCGSPSQTPTVEPTQEVTPTFEPTATNTVTPTLNAPDLSAEVICQEDGSIVFLVTNNGGDMPDAVNYTVADTDSNLVDSGNIQLAAGGQTSLQYWVTTGLTLTVGDLVIVSNPTCVPSTPPTTPEVTPIVTPDVTPTVEPTAAPDLTGQSYCQMDGSILFVLYNYGSDMTEPEYYTVTDSNNNIVGDGYAQVMNGQPFPLYFAGYASLAFTMGNLVITSPNCGPVSTPEPTVQVTPPVDNSVLVGSVSCQNDGSILFVITNTGDSMPDSVYFSVTDPNSTLVDDGWLQLTAGQSTNLQYWGYTRLTFTMGALVITQDSECIPPTPEVSPTPEPTQEITPTTQPTNEVTPTVEPTVTVTPSPTPTQTGTLGCQKNNPDRKDCSSLQVTGTCQGGIAVFTVRNTGKAGEGDMVSSTQYRIIVDGVIVQTGTVQLLGNTSIQITYRGSGTVTLEADQQTGHPGNSQPQATVSCST